jgi:hypothetical protein
MSENQTIYIEEKIVKAVNSLLTGQVNEILKENQFIIPVIEFGDFRYGCTVAPVVSLSVCEQTEKERIIRLDAYTLLITFILIDTPESELQCYAYSGAVGRAIYEDPTLGGIVNRAVITGKKYIQPKIPHCGEGWGLVITLRITVEGMNG